MRLAMVILIKLVAASDGTTPPKLPTADGERDGATPRGMRKAWRHECTGGCAIETAVQ
jgi:hypothetical protein